jgi:hypothetical protein
MSALLLKSLELYLSGVAGAEAEFSVVENLSNVSQPGRISEVYSAGHLYRPYITCHSAT